MAATVSSHTAEHYAMAAATMEQAPHLAGQRTPTVPRSIQTAQSYDYMAQGLLIQPSDIFSITATPCMRWMLTGGADGIVRKWDFFASMNGQSLLTSVQRQGHMDSVVKSAVLLSQWTTEAKPQLASEVDDTGSKAGQGAGGGVVAMDLDPGTPVDMPLERRLSSSSDKKIKLARPSPVYSLAIHSEAVWALAGMEDGGIQLYTVRHEEGRCHHVLRQHTASVSALCITPDEMGAWSGSWDRQICTWDLNTGQAVHTFTEHGSQITSISLRPLSDDTTDADSNLLLSSSIDGQCLVWDRRQAAPARRLPLPEKCPPWCLSACWRLDGQRIYAGRRHGAVDEWDFGEGRLVQTLRFPQNSGPVSSVAAMPNRRHLLCASTDNIRLWDLNLAQDGRRIPFRVIPGHHGGIISHLFVDPSGQYLVSTPGNRGWEGASNRTCLFYQVKAIS